MCIKNVHVATVGDEHLTFHHPLNLETSWGSHVYSTNCKQLSHPVHQIYFLTGLQSLPENDCNPDSEKKKRITNKHLE